MRGSLCAETLFLLMLLSSVTLAQKEDEKTIRIDSVPSGAHVIINGRDRGTTPFEMKAGSWYFDTKKPTAFSKHINEPWVLEVSKDGFRTETIQMTRGPFTWTSLNHLNSYQYWVMNSPSYMVRLRPISRSLTNTDIIDLLKAGVGESIIIDKIQTSACEFHTDPPDIVELHKRNVTDGIIIAMMHATPQDPTGPATTIQPTKK